MGGKRKAKSRQHIVSSEVYEPAKNSSTCNPNVDWETCTEQQLENIIRKKLEDLYGDALYRLLSMEHDQVFAVKWLLERGYCFGIGDCFTNVVLNCLPFLPRPKEEDQPPQPFLKLELLLEFNLQFMVYILQKYRPNFNRTSACRYLLMNNLNLNRAILMDVNDTTEMLSNLNLDHDKEKGFDKDRFLVLEIREMLNNLNVVDDSVSEDMKDMMIANSQKKIDDLEEQLKERIRWATKKVAEARRNQTAPNKDMMEEIRLFHKYTKNMLCKKELELSSINNELDIGEKAFDKLEREKEEIEAEILASKLIMSETKEKCLESSKCDQKKKKEKEKDREKQKVKLEEEMAMEKEKISKWEEELVGIEAAMFNIEIELGEIMKDREVSIALLEKEKSMVERWTI